MDTYYLDNNALAYLTDQCTDTEHARLLGLVDAKRIGITASVHSFMELTRLHGPNPEHYCRQLALLQGLVGYYVFQPYGNIMAAEIRTRQRLPRKDALIGPEWINNFYAGLMDPAHVTTKASQVARENQRSVEAANDRKRSFLEKAHARCPEIIGKPQRRANQIRRGVRDALPVDEKQVQDWYSTVVAKAVEDRSINLDDLPPIRRLPCTHAFVSIFLAAMRRRHGLDRKEQPSDNFDIMHYAQSSYCDFLVSNDKDFCGHDDKDKTGLLNNMSCRKLKVISFDVFLAKCLERQ